MDDRKDVDVTGVLHKWGGGDQAAVADLVPLVLDELHRIAVGVFRSEGAGHTLQPTAVVNEAYLRLARDKGRDWQDRRHFYRVAAKVMRHVLIEHARRRGAGKRPPQEARTALEHAEGVAPRGLDIADLVAIHYALERLEQLDDKQAAVVELRVFAGRTVEEIATELELSESTVKRYWKTAKAWLKRELETGTPGPDSEANY